MPDWIEIITRIGAAALVGGAIGLNRHLHHKAVGLRTLSLVACTPSPRMECRPVPSLRWACRMYLAQAHRRAIHACRRSGGNRPQRKS
jgi:hypothetical protein